VLDPQFNVELPDFALSEQRDPEVLSA